MARFTLTTPTSIYASLAGDDSWDGLTLSTPKRHIQAAVDLLCSGVDPAGFQPTIQLIGGSPSAPSVFSETVQLYNYLPSALSPTIVSPVLRGDPAHPKSYVIDGGGSQAVFAAVVPMVWTLDGFSVQSVGGVGVQADNTSIIYGRNLRFGPSDVDILSQTNSNYAVAGNYSVFGKKTACHWRSAGGIIITQGGWTCTLEPGVEIDWVFARSESNGWIETATNFNFSYPAGATWVQSSAVGRSGIETNGLKNLPGVYDPAYNDASSYSN